MMNRTNTVLALLLAAVIVMTAGVGVDYSKPNIEILPDMKYTPAWEAFAANPVLPHSRTMQPPVPGTIARGQSPLYYAATKEDAVRAGEELENPVSLIVIEAAVAAEREEATANEKATSEAAPAADAASPATEQPDEDAVRAGIARQRFSASVERGSDVYRTFCVSCHGAKGAGDGPVTQRGFPPPPSMLSGKSLQMKDGQLFHILTYGQGSMAPFAAQLSRDQRWAVINYVRDLQSKAPAVPGTEPTATEEEPPATDGNAKPVENSETEPGSGTPSPPVGERKKSPASESSKEREPQESKAPRNALRAPPPEGTKQTAPAKSQVPNDDSESNTGSES